jgi:hypothetical protein
MSEEYEFRVDEDFADRLLFPMEGKKLGSVRVVRLQSKDPRLP